MSTQTSELVENSPLFLKKDAANVDMKLGGAERLVVDAAVGLQRLGHDVNLYTSYHDPGHCFEETRDGSRASSIALADLLIILARHPQNPPRRPAVSAVDRRQISHPPRPSAAASSYAEASFMGCA